MTKSALTFALLLAACGGPRTSPAPSSPTSSAPASDPGCVCAMIYKPVCGADGKTYSNTCAAACAKVRVAAEGACP